MALLRETGQRDGEAWALNGPGEAAHTAGHTADALAHHAAALTIAADIGTRDQQAHAHTGLGHAHTGLNHPARAREHYQHALALYTDLGMWQADQIRAHVADVDNGYLVAPGGTGPCAPDLILHGALRRGMMAGGAAAS